MMDLKSTCCVVGAILINLTLGTFYSIGNVMPYVASYMREHGNPNVNSEHGAWVVATFLLGQGMSIIAGSYIEQHYNSRVACITGCIFHCVSTFMTMWAINININVVILIYGFGSGLGCGSAYMASIIAAQKWFPNRKGFFTGLIVAGFGFGGLIFTNLQTWYLNPKNISPSTQTGYFGPEVTDRVPTMFLYLGIIFTVVQTIGCILAFPGPSPPPGQEGEGASRHKPGNTASASGHGSHPIIIYGEDALPEMTSVWAAFYHRIFYVTAIMMMLVAPGVTFVNSLGKSFGQTFIDDDRYLATVVAVAAVANASGRLTWGFLADKFTFSTCFAIKVALFATLIVLFPFEWVLRSRVCYMIWMLGLFFGFSGTFVLFPVFVEQVFGAKFHGIIYGILYIFLAISSIITSFVTQLSVAKTIRSQLRNLNVKLGTRLWPCAIIACFYVLSYIIYMVAIPTRKLETAIKRRKDMEMAKTRGSLANRPDLLVADRNLLNFDQNGGANEMQKENSLGSIVKFAEATPDADAKVKQINRFTNWR